VHYSDDPRDLGNVADYDEFVERLAQIYESLCPLLKNKAYLTIIVKNVKKGGKIYPLAWDLAKRLSETYTLKDEKIWCLPPEECVWSERGLTPIGEIRVGERVLTHTGRLEPVTQVMRREHHGPLLSIKPALLGGAVRLTPGHEVLVVKRRHYSHANGEQFHELFEHSYARGPVWIPAEQICEGDAVAFPVPHDALNTQGLSTSSFLDNKDTWLNRGDWLETRGRGKHGRGRLPATLKFDRNFLRLAGWYISEGSCSVSGLNIANYDANCRQDIAELLTRVFEANVSDDGRGIWCRSRSIAHILGAIFGRTSHHKHLPGEILHLPLTKQAELLSTLWRGDGHVSDSRVTYKTVSKQLAWDIAYLSMRIGAVPYIQQSPDWLNLIYRGEDAQQMRAALGFKSKTVAYNRSQHWLRDGLFWLPVREILRETYSGEVCNLAVANTNSYVARSFVVHNCQDNQRLAPYGLGNAWVSNTFHHYCLQFRKE
jgi:intein/homing endonuclease